MAITLNGSIQTADQSGGTAVTTHTGTNSGESVLIGVIWREDTGVSVSGVDVGGQAATSTTVQITNAGHHRQQFWYLPSLSSGGSKTVTVTFSGTVLGTIFSAVLAGTNTASLVQDRQTATGNDTTPTVSVTTSSSDDALFAMVSSGAGSPTPGTGFTDIPMTDFWVFCGGEYDLSAGVAGAKTVDSSAASGIWGINAIVMKASGGGGGAAAAPTLMLMGIGT